MIATPTAPAARPAATAAGPGWFERWFGWMSRPVAAQLDGEWLRFDVPEYGVAPGQAAVLYDGDRVLGGGWIEETVAVELALAS